MGFIALFFWQASTTLIRFFNQSYRHPVRACLLGLYRCVSLFFIPRAEYSIISLVLVSLGWVVWSIRFATAFINIKPAQRIVGHPQVLEQLSNNTILKRLLVRNLKILI